MKARDVQTRLRGLANVEIANQSARFFKTGPGEYGEGDQFLGVRVPEQRVVAKEFRALPLAEIGRLLQSKFHEDRLTALLIATLQAAKADESTKMLLFDFYLANTARINNWDLVDTTAPVLVGGYLLEKSRRPLYQLSKSRSLWERRIAIIATQAFIRRDDFDDTLRIAEQLLGDHEDLIHKAVGWMLREVGNRDQSVLESFLIQHGKRMPRTALRYSIERLPEALRQEYLGRR